MAFKLYGYRQSDDEELLELREATVCVSAAEARALSEFFARCAQEMESTPDWDHVHFSGGSVPDLIVTKLSEKIE